MNKIHGNVVPGKQKGDMDGLTYLYFVIYMYAHTEKPNCLYFAIKTHKQKPTKVFLYRQTCGMICTCQI